MLQNLQASGQIYALNEYTRTDHPGFQQQTDSIPTNSMQIATCVQLIEISTHPILYYCPSLSSMYMPYAVADPENVVGGCF